MNTITATQLKRMIDSNEQFELVNVLPEVAFRKEHIPGSSNLPADDQFFTRHIGERAGGDFDRKIVVYCASPQCSASATAADMLEAAGFTDVLRFEDGMQGWKNAGYPIESGSVRA